MSLVICNADFQRKYETNHKRVNLHNKCIEKGEFLRYIFKITKYTQTLGDACHKNISVSLMPQVGHRPFPKVVIH